MRHPMRGPRRPLSFAYLIVLSAALASGGCSTPNRLGACLAYAMQPVKQTMSMRGHGYVEVTTETLVCTQRSEGLVAAVN